MSMPGVILCPQNLKPTIRFWLSLILSPDLCLNDYPSTGSMIVYRSYGLCGSRLIKQYTWSYPGTIWTDVSHVLQHLQCGLWCAFDIIDGQFIITRSTAVATDSWEMATIIGWNFALKTVAKLLHHDIVTLYCQWQPVTSLHRRIKGTTADSLRLAI